MKLFENRRMLILMVAAAVGVFLMLIGGKTEVAPAEYSSDVYAKKIESELLALCSSVAGVSDCSVAVSFLSGYTYEYSSRGDVIAVNNPKVCGVAIVCRGGEIPTIERELVKLVSAYLGLGASQISVSGK